MLKYMVKTLVFPNGERLPVMMDRMSGVPEFYPNLYAVTFLRQVNLASSSIDKILRTIAILQTYFDERNINIVKRIWQGELFSLAEIDGLVRYCRQSFRKTRKGALRANVHFLSTEPEEEPRVTIDTYVVRLRHIHTYLKWLITERKLDKTVCKKVKQKLERDGAVILEAISSRTPITSGHKQPAEKKALPMEATNLILSVATPESPYNPWKHEFVKRRNQLVLELLFRTGLRSGELLGLKVEDIVFESDLLKVVRRPDDRDDPRKREPNVKTVARDKTLPPEVVPLLMDYILYFRGNIKRADAHTYLIISSTGQPLSRTRFNEICLELRKHFGQLPRCFTSHICRHTFSTNLAISENEKGNDTASIHNTLRLENGWSHGSSMPAYYTQTFIREEARKAILSLQDVYMNRGSDG